MLPKKCTRQGGGLVAIINMYYIFKRKKGRDIHMRVLEMNYGQCKICHHGRIEKEEEEEKLPYSVL